ncbi:HNH endonuclease [Agrococcus jejuensis]|uniref:HNH endonuclease n=1 Tax=Agrococcus jejuensis TaxID=399736 RepID=A0A1G8G3B1_9MICO|nr:HNH endonuclease [Agrococcus jejuensis]SDH88894.1 HNH endonuclease [Agrococcus jejuensis]
MAERLDGTQVPEAQAFDAWALAAHTRLTAIARQYNRTITYAELADEIQRETGLFTRKRLPSWIGRVLEDVAGIAVAHGQPSLSALCVRKNGTIGDGYLRAPRIRTATLEDVEQQAALDRWECYKMFADRLPIDGGRPTLTPEHELRTRTDERWIGDLLDRGVLHVDDNVPFPTHVEVARLFGRDYAGHQRAIITIDANVDLWFPKIYPNGDWDNVLTSDGNEIEMRPRENGRFSDVMQQRNRDIVIAFGHVKPRSGRRYYKFLGVFQRADDVSNDAVWVHRRLSDSITFDGQGAYAFEVASLAVDDDQLAERSEFDPVLVAEIQARVDGGDFSVPDRFATTKVRGSTQAVFARMVKSNFGWRCAVTGIGTKEFLVASHIIPWSKDDQVRADPSNGICLSTFVDRAFDTGYLTITPDLRTKVRWERVGEDDPLREELQRIDDLQVAAGLAVQPDPSKLRRRAELGY